MASGLFNTGELLRVAPLITTTATLHYAWDEHFFLSIFLSDVFQKCRDEYEKQEAKTDAIQSHQPSINSVIPRYFAGFFYGAGTIFLVGANAATMVTAGMNLKLRALSANPIRWCLYAAGLGFTIGHFLCVPMVMWSVKALLDRAGQIMTGEEVDDEEPSKELWRWLKGHYIRTLLADIPGWLCFLGAVIV
ncbi:hypothetical protein KEM54_000449 [Ascosphaera aggregata]|nr:hypothetical protein KEM54_000449 [Ascosphaera aggregata]